MDPNDFPEIKVSKTESSTWLPLQTWFGKPDLGIVDKDDFYDIPLGAVLTPYCNNHADNDEDAIAKNVKYTELVQRVLPGIMGFQPIFPLLHYMSLPTKPIFDESKVTPECFALSVTRLKTKKPIKRDFTNWLELCSHLIIPIDRGVNESMQLYIDLLPKHIRRVYITLKNVPSVMTEAVADIFIPYDGPETPIDVMPFMLKEVVNNANTDETSELTSLDDEPQ